MAGKVILVVDDEEINLEMIAAVLESNGYHVLKVSDASRAIEIVDEQKRSISAILMDLIMPVCDGFIAIRTIKGKSVTRLIPIIALTASSDKESVIKAVTAGADEYLTQPFNPEDLLERVKAACKISDFNKRWNVYAK